MDRLQEFIDSYGLPFADDIAYYIDNKDYDKVYDIIDENRALLRTYPGFSAVEKYASRPDVEKTAETLAKEYSNVNDIPDVYLEEIAEANNISVDDLKSNVNNKLLRKSYDTTEESNKTDIELRKKQLENVPWYGKVMMSDAAKNRYIKDPEHSVFYQTQMAAEGDENANPWSTKTINDRADVVLGALGAGADFLPGPGGVVFGPAIRGLRTSKNAIIGDAVDAVDAVDVAKSIGSDILSNVGVNYAPTAWINFVNRRAANAANDVTGAIKNALWEGGVIETAKKMKKDLSELGKMVTNSKKARNAANEELPKTFIEQGIIPQKSVNVEDKFAEDLVGNTFYSDIAKTAQAEDKPMLDVADEYVKRMRNTERPYDTYTNEAGKSINISNQNIQKAYEKRVGKNAKDYILKQAQADAAGKLGKGVAKTKELFGKTAPGATKVFGPAFASMNKVPDVKYESKDPTEKYDRWSKGFATQDEMKSKEYKDWFDANTRRMMGVGN